jgi:hypothetical protein
MMLPSSYYLPAQARAGKIPCVRLRYFLFVWALSLFSLFIFHDVAIFVTNRYRNVTDITKPTVG